MKFFAAGRNMTMTGHKVGPVKLQLGSKSYKEILHVAPIEDEMLIGFDFLLRLGAKLDMEKHVLTIGKESINLRLGSEGAQTNTSKVVIAKRIVIPPNSVARVECKLDRDLPDYVVEPDEHFTLILARSFHSSDKPLVVCAVNLTDNSLVLKKG